jgi:release factor glutamine methyltransferase
MKIRQYRELFIKTLSPIHGEGEAESFFYLILEVKQQLKRIDLALGPDMDFTEAETLVWDTLVEQLKLEIPIQYLLGKTSFCGLDFEVNSSVLIPRPETEELVDWILETNKSKVESQKLRILDIGTGSGCIAISLAKNISTAEVFALDVSKTALATAKINAEVNKVDVMFIAQNILQTNDLGQQFDVIVSNPPYVRNLEKQEIKKNVLDNEPHLALFVEDTDALVFYRKISELAKKHLLPNGQLFFEINQYLGKETSALLTEMGFKNVELRKDIYGNDRMVKATVQ